MAPSDATPPPPRALTLDEAIALHLAMSRPTDEELLDDITDSRFFVPRRRLPPCPECGLVAQEIVRQADNGLSNLLTFSPCGHRFTATESLLEAASGNGSGQPTRIPHPRRERPLAPPTPAAQVALTVQGRCPACHRQSLFLGDGGYVTCRRLECADPEAATNLLERDPTANPEA